MGTIITRKRKDGTTVYGAQIVIKRKGKIVHRESRSFENRKAANRWIDRREDELTKPGGLKKQSGKKLSDAIDKYIETSIREIGRTKAQVLNTIKRDFEIADIDCSDIDSRALIDFATELSERVSPSTTQNYMSHLGAIFSIAQAAWGFELDKNEHTKAMAVTKKLGLTDKGKQRTRRPSLQELNKIMEYYLEKAAKRKQEIPMEQIIPFAIFSTRRQEEICSLAWDDLQEDAKRIWVRNMKHPGEKVGNDVLCDLPDPALAYIQAQPRSDERIFPFNHRSVGASFTNACKFLSIDDLRFHDLRHEGVTRLFEMDYTIPRAASVSGHRSWSSLKRYTHIKERGDKYEGWEHRNPPTS